MDEVVTQDLINQFKEFTGSDNDDVARQTLKACDGNLEQAVGLFFASDGAIETNPRQNRPVQIDSDDDVQVLEEQINRANNEPPIVLDDSEDEDGVRRPMIPVMERLVGQSYTQSYGTRSRREPVHPIFEQDHDFLYDTNRRRGQRGNANSADAPVSGSRDLASLFRPPVDIIERRDWNALLKHARDQNRWILVNIQDASEFACQVLNRDCWSNEALKDFIKSHFLFWQDYVKNPDGERVVGYYGIKKYPAVFIVDPRTAEKVQTITESKPAEVLNELADFYERYPTFAAYDAELRAKMMPALNKPSTSVEFSLDDNEDKSHSNGVSQPVASTSSMPASKTADQASSSVVHPEEVSSILAAPATKPTAEMLRERREKFLQELEKKQ